MPNPFKAIWKGLKTTGKVIAKVDDVIDELPGIEAALIGIPVAGPALAIALKHIDIVQALLPAEGAGPERREAAEVALREDLERMGFEPEFAHEVVALAFLLRKGRAGILKEEK